jgi:hypothetical protein
MTVLSPGRDKVVRELQQAVARLQDDLARVEFWADALGGFSKPVPDYEQSGGRLNAYILPYRKVEDALDRIRDDLENPGEERRQGSLPRAPKAPLI